MSFSESTYKGLIEKSLFHIQELISSEANPQKLRIAFGSLEQERALLSNVDEDRLALPLSNQIHALCEAIEQTFNFIREKEETRVDCASERDISIRSLDDLSLANISQFGNNYVKVKAKNVSTTATTEHSTVNTDDNIHDSSDVLSSTFDNHADNVDNMLTDSSDDNYVDENEISGSSGRKKTSKKFKCSICNRFLVSKQSLEYHMTTHLPDDDPRKKMFECVICRKFFSSKHQLRCHERVHIPKNDPRKKRIECKTCNKFFWDKGDLRKHAMIHSEELEKRRPYECDDCGKRFSRPEVLNNHKKTHLPPDDPRRKTFICNADGCEKRYAQSHSLLEHMKIHLPPDDPRKNEKEFICDICGKHLSCRSVLYTHKKIHKEELPYKCGECGKKFAQLVNMNRHRNTVHLAEGDPSKQIFECSVCGKMVTDRSALYVHKRMHEVDEEKRLPFKCDICGKRFDQQGNFLRHKNIHLPKNDPQRYQFTCEICNKSYTEKGALRAHQRSHLDTEEARLPFKCEDCGKRFNSASNFKKHRNFVHLGLKYAPWKCEICGKLLASKRGASKHMKNLHGTSARNNQNQTTSKMDNEKRTNLDVNEKGAWSDDEISEDEVENGSDDDDEEMPSTRK